jgi:hypothetical protein
MRKVLGRFCCAVAITAGALSVVGSNAFAIDTVADWTGENTNASNTTMTTVMTVNNYKVISDTSVGGQVQSKIDLRPENFSDINEQHVYLSDPTLDDGAGGTLNVDYNTPMHMTGTITFSSPTATEPNFFFGWYSSLNTAKRIGLGVSNSVETGFVAEPDFLRVDLGYGATGGNKFYFASGDGTNSQVAHNSVLYSNTYPFTFDYVPQVGGGSISATVGTYHFTRSPMDTQPWDLDPTIFDRFGIIQRSTGSITNNPVGPWNVVFANMTYTGGTAIAGATVPPDFNASGTVGGADLAIWKTNFGATSSVTASMGDADGDGDVDGHDFTYWQSHVNAASVSAAPEPSAVMLLVLASLFTTAGARRRVAA